MLDEYGRPFTPLANIVITPEPSVTIEGDEGSIELTICNNGDQDFAGPLYISLYTNMGEVVQTDEFSQGLRMGECETFNLTYDLSNLKNFEDPFPLYVMLNDEGYGIAQYGGLQAECDTSDNTYSFDGRPCKVIVPNVITPNGDGINDTFDPQLEGDFISLNMEIYNRWGKRVYQQQSNDNLCWDAANVSDGVYFCAIEYHCMTDGKKKKGLNTSVTVVR